jgi:hypothetical protein
VRLRDHANGGQPEEPVNEKPNGQGLPAVGNNLGQNELDNGQAKP